MKVSSKIIIRNHCASHHLAMLGRAAMVEQDDAPHVKTRWGGRIALGLKAVGRKLMEVLRWSCPRALDTKTAPKRSSFPYARASSLERIHMHAM